MRCLCVLSEVPLAGRRPPRPSSDLCLETCQKVKVRAAHRDVPVREWGKPDSAFPLLAFQKTCNQLTSILHSCQCNVALRSTRMPSLLARILCIWVVALLSSLKRSSLGQAATKEISESLLVHRCIYVHFSWQRYYEKYHEQVQIDL